MSEATIDRLVLDIPGMDPAAARGIADGIAESLVAAGAIGDVPKISLTLEAGKDESAARLAARIAAALLQRIG